MSGPRPPVGALSRKSCGRIYNAPLRITFPTKGENSMRGAPTKNVGADSISARARLRQGKLPRAHIQCAPTESFDKPQQRGIRLRKHLFRIIAVLAAAVLLAGCAASRLRLGAAAAGGVYNAFGTAMAAQNSTIEVKQTAGSAANLRLLAGGYLQLAVAQSDMAQDAYDGSGIFAHESTERSFSAVAALYEEAVQVVVRADSGITTPEELQGCTVSVGEEESGTEQNAGQVLAACGLNNRLVHTVNLNYTDAAARLADGTIDAMFVTAGLHADALEQLADTCAIRLLSVDGGVGARLLAAYPAYRACVIPAGTYAGQDEDVWTVSVQALLLASNALSDETVQRLTAKYFDSVDAVAAAVPVPLVTDPAEAAAQSVIPYHTGAAAYYAAQGITPASPETAPEQEAAA